MKKKMKGEFKFKNKLKYEIKEMTEKTLRKMKKHQTHIQKD